MIPDRFQYVLDNFWNFENLVKFWTRRPPNYYQKCFNEKIWEYAGKRLSLEIWESTNVLSKKYVLGTKLRKQICPRYTKLFCVLDRRGPVRVGSVPCWIGPVRVGACPARVETSRSVPCCVVACWRSVSCRARLCCFVNP